MPSNNPKTHIIYLIGKPGVGKYTIAKELAKHGFIICDNQLVNNVIFSLMQLDGTAKVPEAAWDAIENIRNCVFEFLSHKLDNNYVLTNVLYETEEDTQIYEQVQTMAQTRGSVFVPVKLTISEDEHLNRIQNPERKDRFKTISTDHVYLDVDLIDFNHPNLLELDVTALSPNEVANLILHYIR